MDTRKALALLAVVTIDGPQTRSALAALLWPDSATSRARGALRRTLSVLGRALGDRWLVAERETIDLRSDGVRSDVAEVARLLEAVDRHGEAPDARCDDCLAALVRSAHLHRGELLEGFGLRDSPEFDDWRTERGEHQRRQLCRTLDLLSRATLGRGDLDTTATTLEQWLRVDPLNEHVHARLMLVHAWRGERTEALHRYRACVAVLDDELGVAPLPRTTQLYHAILEDRVGPTPSAEQPFITALPDPATGPSAAAPRSAEAPDAWPVVGRDHVLEAMATAHETSRGGALVVVTGEAGIGKTRLAEAFRHRVASSGGRTATARCYPGESGLAFGPIVDLLRQAAAAASPTDLQQLSPLVLAEAGRLAPALLADGSPLPEAPPLDSPGARALLFEAVWETLDTALAGGRRGLVVLDELQSIDPSTLELLSYGLHRLAGRNLTVITCLRREDAPAALVELLDDTVLAPVRHAIGLTRLAPAATVDLVSLALGDQPAPPIAERLHMESEGLPLLLVEYLRLIVDGEVDAREDDWTLPHGARELARSRMSGLSEGARQIAATVAAIGRSFDLDVAWLASGRSETELVTGLEELLERRLVVEVPGEAGQVRYDFTHDKLRAAIHETTSLARRRLLHGRIAEVLATGTRGGRDAGALAAVIGEHARLAGRDENAAGWFARAGDHARSLYANAEALGHIERALALGHPETWRLRVTAGELSTLLGDYASAVTALEAAAAHAADDDELARTEHQLGVIHLRRGDVETAAAHLETARSLLRDDQAGLAARIEADLGLLELRAGALDDATGHAHRALELAEVVDDVEARAQALNLLGVIARHGGDPAAAREHLERSAALAETLDDPTAHVAALNNLALAAADAGAVESAIELQRQAVTRGARRGDRHREAALRNNLADLLHRAGNDVEAMAELEAAVGLFAGVDDTATPSPEIWKLVDW